MSLQKWTLAGTGLFCVIGLILRALGVSFGLDLMILAVLGGIISLAFAQRNTQYQLATTRRNLTQRLRELGDDSARLHKALDELVPLQRTTLWYVKNRPGSGIPTTDLGRAHRNGSRSGLAGRSSTPEVMNSTAGVSFARALDPGRSTVVGGLLSPAARDALPASTTVRPFMPARAVESLDVGEPLDLIVIDEAAFSEDPWSLSVGPTGVALMRDLLDAVRLAREQGVQTVLLPFDAVPDIHSTTMRSAPVLQLPLTEDLSAQASGAPLTPVLAALEGIAARRGAL